MDRSLPFLYRARAYADVIDSRAAALATRLTAPIERPSAVAATVASSMSEVANPMTRYEQGRPMLFAGIRRKHTFAKMGQDIPRQWEDFVKLGKLPGQVGYDGLRCDLRRRPQDADHGVHVRRRGHRASTRCRRSSAACACPAVRYAVFRHEGNVATIQARGKQYSRGGCRARDAVAEYADFEVYDERFDGATGEGGVESGWASSR